MHLYVGAVLLLMQKKNVSQTFFLQFKDMLSILPPCCVSRRPQGGATHLQIYVVSGFEGVDEV